MNHADQISGLMKHRYVVQLDLYMYAGWSCLCALADIQVSWSCLCALARAVCVLAGAVCVHWIVYGTAGAVCVCWLVYDTAGAVCVRLLELFMCVGQLAAACDLPLYMSGPNHCLENYIYDNVFQVLDDDQ